MAVNVHFDHGNFLLCIAYGRTRKYTPMSKHLYSLEVCEYLLSKKAKLSQDCAEIDITLPESAQLYHSLGRIFKLRSFEDQSFFVKAAVCFMTAIVRDPFNEEYEADFIKLCARVLSFAGVSETEMTTLERAQEEFSIDTLLLRDKVNQKLLEIEVMADRMLDERSIENQRILLIEEIKKLVERQHSQIRNKLIDVCFSLTKCRTQYSFKRVGNFIRTPQTHYSLFGPAIFHKDRHGTPRAALLGIRKSFENLWVIFEVLMIVCETMTSSISLHQFYLGRQSDHDLVFLSVYAHDKNRNMGGLMQRCGESLHEVLEKCCIATGSILDNVVHCFVVDGFRIVKRRYINLGQHLHSINIQHINGGNKTALQYLAERFREKIQEFSFTFWPEEEVWQAYFRILKIVRHFATDFVELLGRCHKVAVQSPFDAIRKLEEQGVVDSTFSQELLHALAIAYQAVLIMERDKNKAGYLENNKLVRKDLVQRFTAKLGVATLLKFIETVMKLQRKVSDTLKLTEFNFLQKSALLDKLLGLFLLHQKDVCFDEAEKILENPLPSLEAKRIIIVILMVIGEVYADEGNQEKAVQCFQLAYDRFDATLSLRYRKEFIHCLHTLAKSILNLYEEDEGSESSSVCGSEANQSDGSSQSTEETEHLEQAVKLFTTELRLRKLSSLQPSKDADIAECHICLGKSNFELENFREALCHFEECGTVYKAKKDKGSLFLLACELRKSGMILAFTEKKRWAFRYFSLELKLRKVCTTQKGDCFLAACYYNIAYCHFIRFDYDNALRNFRLSQKLLKQVGIPIQERRLRRSPLMIGRSLARLGRSREALSELREALRLFSEFTENPTRDYDIATCHYHIGECLFDLMECKAALVQFSQAREIYLSIEDNGDYETQIKNCLKMEEWCRRRINRRTCRRVVLLR